MRALLLAATMFVSALAVAQTSAPPKAQPITPEVRKRIEQQVRMYSEAPPDAEITVGTPEASDFPTFDSVPVTIRTPDRAQTYKFVVSQDRTKLFYVKSFDLTQDPYAKVMHAINLNGRPTRGAKDPQVTLVMYDDYECPFCARMYITLMNEVLNRYRDKVQVVLKDFPLTDTHPWAMDAALAANCVAAQSNDAYWAFSDYLHTHQQAVTAAWKQSNTVFESMAAERARATGANADAVKACVEQHDVTAIQKSMAEARSLGVSATPGLFINGQIYVGELTIPQLRAALDRALKDASTTASN